MTAPTTPKSGNPLPSFSDLLASLSRPSSTPPSPPSHQAQHPHHRQHRPQDSLPKVYGRPRAATAPSLPTSHMQYHRPALARHHHHSLPAPGMHRTRSGSYEHFTDRIEALRQGDGVWNQFDACCPELVPEHARPHRAYYPPASSPPHCHPSPPHHYPQRSSFSTSFSYDGYAPASPPRPHLHHLGSHSPLSTNSPLTPVSIYGVLDERDRQKDEAHAKDVGVGVVMAPAMGREEWGVGMEERGVRIPRLPRMK